MSLLFDIGERARRVSRFLGAIHRELQQAVEEEKATRKLTQQQIADTIGVNRSVINRQILGGGNLTLRRVAEFAWALGREPVFELRKISAHGNYANPVPQTEGAIAAPDSSFPQQPAANGSSRMATLGVTA